MNHPRYQAVIFDLDGVLTDTAHFHFMAWKLLAESQNIVIDAAFNEQLKGVDRMGSLERILALSQRDYSNEEKLALAESKNIHYQQLIAHMGPQDLLPGALAALTALRAGGLKLAIASVSKNALAVVDSLGIRSYFDVIVDAALIKHSKPDPEIFLTAASLLKIAPENCLGVEDSIAGITAIKASGMVAIGIGKPEVLTEADNVIPDLQTLMEYVH